MVALLAPVLRFRRAQGVERQQLKWFAYGALLLVAGGAALFVPLSEGVAKAIVAAGLGCFTAGVAVAVLGYGLYEIDVVLNRTLVYGLLTVLLGLGYAAAVLVGGQLVGQERSSLAVAAATLAVAAVFQPARRRVQATVDPLQPPQVRRGENSRGVQRPPPDEVDLDALSAELLAVADHTMQPTTVTLWLRPSAQAPPRGQWRKAGPTPTPVTPPTPPGFGAPPPPPGRGGAPTKPPPRGRGGPPPPAVVIVLAVRWYLRFGLSYRDVEELLTERGDRGRPRHHLPVGAAVHAAAGRRRPALPASPWEIAGRWTRPM